MLKKMALVGALFLGILSGCGTGPEQVDLAMDGLAMEKDIMGPDESCSWSGCPKDIELICPDEVAPLCKYNNNTLALSALLPLATTYGRVCTHPADLSYVSYIEIDTPTSRKKYYYYQGKLVAFLRVDKLGPDPACRWGDTRFFYGKLPFWCCP